MKKILFCIDTLEMTGASASLVSLLHVLDYSKYDVSLFLFNQKGEYLKDIPPEVHLLPEIPAYMLSCAAFKDALKRGFRARAFGLILKRILLTGLCRYNKRWNKVQLAKSGPVLSGEYDLAIGYCCSYVWSFIVDKVQAKKRVAWMDTDHHRVMDAWNAYARPAEWDAIACVCGGEVQSMRRDFPELADKVCVVHNIIEKSKIMRFLENSSFSLDQSTPHLVTVGRITDQKGQDLIISIVMELLHRQLKFKWHLIGPGADKWENYLTRAGSPALEDVLVYEGALNNPYGWMAGGNLYVQPSRWEGWGLTVTEAVAVGAAVLVSDIPAFREQIVDGVNGFIVPLDVKAFADKIEAYLTGKCKLNHQGHWLTDYTRPTEFDAMCKGLFQL